MDSPDNVVPFCKSDVPFIAGHDLLELTYQFDSMPNSARMITRRNYKLFNTSTFLSSLDFDFAFPVIHDCCSVTGVDVDVLADSVRGTIVTALDAQAPLQTFRVHRTRAPWLSLSLSLLSCALGIVTPSLGMQSFQGVCWPWLFIGNTGMSLGLILDLRMMVIMCGGLAR